MARTVAENVEASNAALWSKTSLLEARLIGGDALLFARFEKAFQAGCVKGQEQAFFAARLADREARRAKFGQAVCLQEPHLQSGCGGLRDYQSLLWLTCFKYGTRSLAELEARGLIITSERVQLEAAYDFLLRVRNEAHYYTGRAADALTKSIQPFVAHGLGYQERSLEPPD